MIDIEKKGKVKSKAAAYKALQTEMLTRGYRQNWKIIADKEKAEGSIFNPLRKKYYRFSIRLAGNNKLSPARERGSQSSSSDTVPDDYLERLIENQNQMEGIEIKSSKRKSNLANNRSVKKMTTQSALKQKISAKDLRLYQDLLKSKQQELGLQQTL